MTNGVRITWEGKRAAEAVSPPPLFCEEQYGTETENSGNRLIQGENLAVMTALRAELAGKFALIYLDPPFFTGKEWEAQRANASPDPAERMHAYTDRWNDDLGTYLQWLFDRLTAARDLLAEDGSLYLHLNWQAAHYAKLLLDEIFGTERFQNEIIWCYREGINSRKRWNRKHDTILFYSKGERFTFYPNRVLEAYSESNVKKYRLRDEKGAYRLMGRGITNSPLRSRRDLPEQYEKDFPDLTYRHYLGEGTLPVDYWRIDIENQASHARTGYPTQKPEALLERILLASTNPGDLVGDFCCGSGTTAVVANRLGRRWIACDSGTLAIHTTKKRLLAERTVSAFSVERAEKAGNEEASAGIQVSPFVPNAVQVIYEGTAACVQLYSEVLSTIDMWYVGWRDEAGNGEEAVKTTFRPFWWSVRTRQSPNIAAKSVPIEVTEGCRLLEVVLTTAEGTTFRHRIRLEPPV